MKNSIPLRGIAMVFLLLSISFTTYAQNKGSTKDTVLEKPLKFEPKRITEKEISKKRNSKVTIPASQSSSRDKAQLGQSTLAAALQTPFTAALTELDKSNDAILKELIELGVLNRMKVDFRRIEKVKNVKTRGRLISQYQARYKNQYQQAIKKSGVDLEGIAQLLSKQVTKGEFVVVDGIYIQGKSKKKNAADNLSSSNSVTRSVVIDDDDVAFVNHGDCALLASSGSGFSNGEIRSGGMALLAGGCFREAEATISLSDYSDFTVKAKFDTFKSSFAGSILGASASLSSSTVNISYSYCSVMAAVLWIASCEDVEQNLELTLGTSYLSLLVRNRILGAVGVSTSIARVRLKNSELMLTNESM